MANNNAIANSIIDYLRQWGINATNVSADLAKWIASHPDKAAILFALVKKAGIGLKAMGGVTGAMKYYVILRDAGFSVKSIIASFAKDTASYAAGKAGLSFATKGAAIASAGKILGLIAAVVIANYTVKQAGKSFNLKISKLQDAIAEGDAGKIAKSGWELYWETRIPVVTYRWIESWFKKNPKSQDTTSVKQISLSDVNELATTAYKKEIEKAIAETSKVYDKTDWSHTGGPLNPKEWEKTTKKAADAINSTRDKHDELIRDAEDVYAKVNGMVDRPKQNTTAETVWKREVETRMNRENPKGNNDPRWHTAGGNENPITLAGTPGFATAKGSFYDSPLISNSALPSTMGIELALTWGAAYYELQDVRKKSIIAAVDAIKAKNRYTTSYNYGAVCKYIVDLRLLYALFALGKTNYQLLLKYQKTDDTLPSGLFAARRFDYATWKNSMSMIRSDLADLKKSISVLAHFDLNLFRRTMQCFNYIYKDSNTRKAQYYTFTLSRRQAYYDFNASTPAWATLDLGARNLSNTSTGMTYAQWLTAITTVVKALSGSVVDEIKKSFIQALGSNMPKELDIPREFEELEFTYSEEILQQIENAECITSIGADPATWAMTDDADGFPVDPVNSITSNVAEKTFLNYHKDTINKNDLIVASRLKYRYGTIDSTTFKSWGSELVVGYKMYTRQAVSTGYNKLHSSQFGKMIPVSGTTAAELISSINDKLVQLVAFDWAPHAAIQLSYSGSTFTSQQTDTVNVDWDNFTVLVGANADPTSPNLNDYNRGSLFGLFVSLETIAKSKANKFNENSDK